MIRLKAWDWSARRMQCQHSVLVGLIGVFAISVLVGACSSHDALSPAGTEGSDIAALTTAAPALQYSDEELSLDSVVDDYVFVGPVFARYRTSDEAIEAGDELLDRIYTATGHERDRAVFETRLYSAMVAANDTLPEDIDRHQGILHDALYEAMDECATDAGWPQVRLYDVSNDVVKEYEREYGLTLDMFLDLRHECSKYAATYPTLDPDLRDELLAERRAHYMEAVRVWMAENPQLVVPVEHHEGDNHPHEDLLVQVCLESDDPEACAREERVTLP